MTLNRVDVRLEVSPLEYALSYAARGWHVLPLKPRGKTPLTQHGLKDATKDPATIRAWWKQWPAANVGIACEPSGLAVIDIDAKSGGLETLDQLTTLDPFCVDTLISRTGGGGAHLVFEGSIPNTTGKIGKGIDSRGKGGYFVAPPSVHESGNAYRWEDETAKAEPLPDFWRVRLNGHTSEPIETEITPAISTGARNASLTRLAGSLRNIGLSADEMNAALQAANRTRCNPPLPEGEVRRIAESISRYAPDQKVSQAADWKAYTLADAYAPREPLQCVVSGLFPLPSLSIVYGAPGTLKSMLLADMMVCVAAGLPWLAALRGEGNTSRAVIQSPAIYIDFDNGARRTHERFDALGHAYNLPADVPIVYYSMPSAGLDAGDNAAMVGLADRIKEHGARLVVIDNLGKIVGKADENTAAMNPVMSNLRWLAEFTGAAVVLIHHQRKANGITSRAGESLRGHSSIEAALDLALLVERDERSSLITMRSTKTRDVDVYPFGAQFTFEHKPDTTELAAARFLGATVEDTGSDRAIEAAILEAVTAHHPLNQTKLEKAVKEALPDVGHNRVVKIAHAMTRSGALKSSAGEKGARLYDLP